MTNTSLSNDVVLILVKLFYIGLLYMLGHVSFRMVRPYGDVLQDVWHGGFWKSAGYIMVWLSGISTLVGMAMMLTNHPPFPFLAASASGWLVFFAPVALVVTNYHIAFKVHQWKESRRQYPNPHTTV